MSRLARRNRWSLGCKACLPDCTPTWNDEMGCPQVCLREERVMQIVRRQFLSLAGAAIATTAIPRIAAAQAYPARPVRVIVPGAPGGPTDLTSRVIAQKLSKQLGRQFYIENIGATRPPSSHAPPPP